MGILINAAVIFFGGLIGSSLKRRVSINKSEVFGICIIIVSIVGFFENVFSVDDKTLSSDSLIIVILALIVGSILGDILKIEDKINHAGAIHSGNRNAFISSSLYFAIGGMQISGAILLGRTGDSSILILKSIVDLPFAIMFGSILGKSTSLSAIPVALLQIILCLVSYILGDFISDECLKQLCVIGYVILFFSGLNLMMPEERKIKNANMLPSLFIIIIYNLVIGLVGV